MSAGATEVNEYRCDVCGFVYRTGDYDGQELVDQPDDFACPDCQSTKGHFQINTEPDDDVEADDDTADEDEDEDDGDPTAQPSDTKPAAKDARRVYTKEWNPSVATLLDLHKYGDLDPQPPYQRYEVWNARKRSKLIESALMDLPLPRFYFAENPTERQEVVDGQQRLQAFFRTYCRFRGLFHRPGRGGQRPPSESIASAMTACCEW